MPGPVPDWFYDALEAFEAHMNDASLFDAALMAVIGLTSAGATIFVHECGHALVAAITGNKVRELRVGDADDVIVTTGGFRLRLGRMRGDATGYVLYDTRSATPRQMLAIALGGPAANLLAAAVTAVLAVRADGMLAVSLFLCALTNLTGLANLRLAGDLEDPSGWSDGRWVQVAWAARHLDLSAGHMYVDPNAATSVAPPAART